MKLSIINMSVGTIRFEVMNRQVLNMLMSQYVAYNPCRIDDDAPVDTPRLTVQVQVDGHSVPAVSMYDLLWLERQAMAEALPISYTKPRIIKRLPLIQFLETEKNELEELSKSSSYRIALSARCARWPDLDVHFINDNYFIRLIGNYWAIIGEQTVWTESDTIKM